MKPSKRVCRTGARRAAAVAAAVAVLGAPQVFAQTYPAKPVRMIVGLAPGGAADVTARMIAQKMSEPLGQPVIVENRTGAGGSIATERVIASPADGYSLLVLTSSATALPALRGAKLTYDMERDLAPITLLASGPWVVVVHPSVPAKNIKELIALARAHPGKLNYGSSGVGGATHLGGEYFNQVAKVKITHVPFKGGADSAIATATGQVDVTYSTIPSVQPLIDARRVKPLAVTSNKRSAAMPSLPTIAESGLPGFDYTIWVGALARAGTPAEIVTRLNRVIGQIAGTPDMKSALAKQGLDARTSTPAEFATLIRREIAQSTKLVKTIGIEPE